MKASIEGRDAASRASPAAPRRVRIALYSHETLGLGHVRRNLVIAGALTDALPGATVLLLSGAVETLGLPLPPRADCVTLPALRVAADGSYESRRLPFSLDEIVAVRSRILAAAVEAFDPDLLVVDKAPRGASREMAPAIDAARGRGTRLVLGLRDVIERPERMRSEWAAADAEAAIRDLYDEVWVYGDAAVHDLRADGAVPPALAERFRFTGYLCGRRDDPDPDVDPLEGLPPGRLALCLLGSGEVGAPLADAFLRAALPDDVNAVVVLGPFLPEEDARRLARLAEGPRRRVLRATRGTSFLTRRADRVVAMAGYNTVCELLAHGRRALLAPCAGPRLEQRVRAARLAELGLVDAIEPEALSPERLAAWIADDGPPPRPRVAVDVGGTERIPELAARLLDGERAGRAR